MHRIYYDTDGTASTIPFNPVEAKRTRSKIYIGEPCPDCEKRERYVKNDVCVNCALLNANDLFCYVAGKMHWEYHPDDPTGIPPLAVHDPVVIVGRERKYFKDRPVTWEHERAVAHLADLVATPDRQRFARCAKEAIDLGLTRFVIPTACETHGHYGIRTLENRCHQCEEDRLKPSPRKAALMAGATWYTPDTPCPYCGTKAERRVYDGKCRGCVPDGRPDGRRSETSIMMEAAPDMVISREDARRLGLKVFRTGQPCRRGHTGFRWVSTGGCLACLKGER